MKRVTLFFSVMLILFILLSCESLKEGQNPVPRLSAISPQSTVAHQPSFILKVNGSGFTRGAKIVFNNVEQPTTFVNETELICNIEPDEIPVSAAWLTGPNNGSNSLEYYTVDVFVRNPSPGDSMSDKMPMTVKSNYTFTTPKALTDKGEAAIYSFSLDHSGNLLLAWSIWDNWAPSLYPVKSPIYFMCSTDNGDNWSSPVQVNTKEEASDFPWVVQHPSGPLWIIYESYKGARWKLSRYLSQSNDNGQTWAEPVQMFQEMQPFWTWDLKFTTGGAYYYATNHRLRNEDEILFYKNDGANFSKPVKVTCVQYDVLGLGIILDSSNNPMIFYYTWNDCIGIDINLIRSNDGGNTWGAPINISKAAGKFCISSFPRVAFHSSGKIVQIWSEMAKMPAPIISKSDILNMQLPLSSENFLDAITDTMIKKIQAYEAGMLLNNANASISNGDITGNKHYISVSNDNGATWEAKIEIVFDQGSNYYLQDIEFDKAGNLHMLVYYIRSGFPRYSWDANQIYYMRSTDLGKSWSTPVNISNHTLGSDNPNMKITDSGEIYIIWRNHMKPAWRYMDWWDVYFCKGIN